MRDSWSVDDVLALRPCPEYCDRDRLLKLWNGQDRLDVGQVAALDIPPIDRVWLLLCGDPEYVRPAIEMIAARVVRTYALHCGIPGVESWAAGWLAGTDRSVGSARLAAAEVAKVAMWWQVEVRRRWRRRWRRRGRARRRHGNGRRGRRLWWMGRWRLSANANWPTCSPHGSRQRR